MSKLITVFGATGNQGGSVIQAILSHPELSQEFKIRGITRDVSKPSAQALAKQGVDMQSANMNCTASVLEAVKGSHTVFLITTPFENTPESNTDLVHGKHVADAAKQAGVQHLIYSSLPNVMEATGGRIHVFYFDQKARVERYIRSIGIAATFVLPGFFMTNYIEFSILRKGLDRTYAFAQPVNKNAQFPLLDAVSDMGKYVVAILKNPSAVLGKQVLAAADYYTPERVVAEFEEVTGKKTRFVQLSVDVFKSLVPGAFGDALIENYRYIEDPGYYGGQSLKESHDLLAEAGLQVTTWKDFLKQNKDRFA